MHIGLIGGIGPAATEFYYRGLIDRHAAAGTTLDLTIAHADVREMSRNLANRDPQKRQRSLPDAGQTHGGGRCAGGSRHLDGRPFLHPRVGGNFATALVERPAGS